MMGNLQKLNICQKGRELAAYIYKLVHDGPLAYGFGLRDQMQRSAASISSNIVQGDELNTSKQAIKHLLNV